MMPYHDAISPWSVNLMSTPMSIQSHNHILLNC
jgi:hypothetical protein